MNQIMPGLELRLSAHAAITSQAQRSFAFNPCNKDKKETFEGCSLEPSIKKSPLYFIDILSLLFVS